MRWVRAAAAACGVTLDRVRGHRRSPTGSSPPGGPAVRCRHRVPPHLAEVWADRDLYAARPPGRLHRAGRDRRRPASTASPTPCTSGCSPGRLAAVRRTPCRPCARCGRPGCRSAVVSNIGFDIRPLFAAWGLADLVDAFVLSYEVGRCKPDPAIFLHACAALRVDPERTLMVGDTPADAGAVRAGCCGAGAAAPASPGRRTAWPLSCRCGLLARPGVSAAAAGRPGRR